MGDKGKEGEAFSALCAAADSLKAQHEKTYTRLLSTVDNLLLDLDGALADLEKRGEGAMEVDSGEGAGSGNAAGQVIAELHAKLQRKDYAKLSANVRKPFRTASVKLQKVIERDLTQVPPSPKDWAAEAPLVDEAIAKHLMRMGRFEEAQAVLADSDTMDLDTDEEAFREVSAIEAQISAGDVDKALAWAGQHAKQLRDLGTGLYFKLHQLKLVQIITQNPPDRLAAVKYARKHFTPFHHDQQKEIQRTMTLLLFVGAQKNPYSELVDPAFPKLLASQFRKDYCSIHDLPERSALLTTTMAGSLALPALQKMAKLSKGHWSEMEQLPVEVNLGNEFKMHSVFVCPVSKEHATPDNPPTMLLCGHVICKSSMEKIGKTISSRSRFKCPYCPTDQQPSQTVKLTF